MGSKSQRRGDDILTTFKDLHEAAYFTFAGQFDVFLAG